MQPPAPLVLFIAVLMVGMRLLTLVHEVGHAIAVVALTGQRVLIQSGHDDSLIRFAIGKIDFRLDPRVGRDYCRASRAGVTPRQWVVVCLAGPLATLAASVLVLALLPLAPNAVVYWYLAGLGGLGVLVSICNLLPFTREKAGSPPSDGWQALAALRKRGTPAWGEPMLPRGPNLSLVIPNRDRFSRVAAAVVTVAARERDSRREPTLTTGHLLLGLTVAEGSSDVLAAAGASREAVRAALAEHRSEVVDAARPGMSGRVVMALRGAVDALSLTGERLAGPEHVLYGVLRQTGGDGCAILARLGADPDALREAITATMKPATA